MVSLRCLFYQMNAECLSLCSLTTLAQPPGVEGCVWSQVLNSVQ